MKSPIVRWLITLNILVLCGVTLAFFVQQHRQQKTQRMLADKIVQQGLQHDDATPDERAQLDVICKSVQKRQALTDDQFSFLLTETSKPNSKGAATASHIYAVMIFDLMKAPLLASQKTILCNRLVPLLQIPDPTVSSGITLTQMHKMEACQLLAHFGVREAIPQIVPLLDDPKPQVRVDAKRALKKLGYNA